MTTIELLTTRRDRGVRLTPNVTTGRVDAPEGTLTPAIRAALREHKAALFDLLEAFEERAAIMEYSGGLSREESERLAWVCVLGEPQP
jgi:hypothetical protein